ncbi:MAG: hypothetical protein JWM57_3588 [Phycisphaerales bacterium]|nr:hypothetical protein [Phycisphaerales bacterium]
MNRTRLIAALCLALAMFASMARADVTSLLPRGQGERFWLIRTDEAADKSTTKSADKAEGKSFTTSIRRLTNPVKGAWGEAWRLNGKFIDAAPLEDRIAVLAEDGTWQLVWDGGSVAGPLPDSGHVLRRIASDGDTLWAIGAQRGEAGNLLKWTESAGWSVVAALPEEADLPDVSMAIYDGRPWLACGDVKMLRLTAFRPEAGGAWQGMGNITGYQATHPYAFVTNTTAPTLILKNAAGQFDLMQPDAASHGLKALRPTVGTPAGWTSFGPSIRLLSIKDNKVEQTVIDNQGRGRSYGPDPVADPALPQHEQSLEWLNVALLLGLTVAMLRSLRSEEPQPPALAGNWVVAPLWRRGLAAIIDGLPLLIVAVWVVYHFGGASEPMHDLPRTAYLAMTLGLIAYVGHVTVSEALFGTSLGKRLFGLTVVDMDGQRVSIERVLLRNVLRIFEVSLFLPVLMPLFTPNSQRIGDLAAKTLVVARAKPAAIPEQPTAE